MNKTLTTLAVSAFALTSSLSLQAEDAASFTEALTEGKPSIDFRLRLENVAESAMDANAITERLRIGYTTGSFNGFSAHADVEDIRAIDDSYNSTQNENTSDSVVADPEDTELNQAFVQFQNDYVLLKAGRQRIKLDNDRFIGNVGWRQDEQTFDAILGTITPVEHLDITAGYIHQINGILGDNSNDSESPLLNVSYAGWDVAKVALFAYLLDLEDTPDASSDTYGIRVTGDVDMSEENKFKWELSYAQQTDAADNTANYNADYYNVKGTFVINKFSFGAAYEVLGSDNGSSFQTPLATKHGFNGYADKFLTTPAMGLENTEIFIGAECPEHNVCAKLSYHFFDSDTGGVDYGEEIDFCIKKEIGENWAISGKVASFDKGDATSKYEDVEKYIVQTDFSF